MHIGLLRRSALGDVILWSALVEQCLRRYPEVKITWMIDPAFIPLFATPSRLHWCALPKPQSWRSFKSAVTLLKQEHFDTLLCAQASLRSNILYPFCRAKRKIGFDPQRGRDGHGFFVTERIRYHDNHLIEGFAQFFEQAGYPLDLTDLRWPIALENDKQTDDTQSNAASNTAQATSTDVGLVIAASKAERTWPVSHQARLVCDLLRSPTFLGNIQLIGGSSSHELSLAQSLKTQCQTHLKPDQLNRLRNHVGKTALTELPALIGGLGCLVAPDTGPAHLARALSVPVIGLYAVARSALTGPYGSPYTIDRFAEAAKTLLGKSDSELSWHNRIHHPDAMSFITPQEVFERTLSVLTDQTPNDTAAKTLQSTTDKNQNAPP